MSSAFAASKMSSVRFRPSLDAECEGLSSRESWKQRATRRGLLLRPKEAVGRPAVRRKRAARGAGHR
jgi:hypothetical protein